MMDLFAIYIIWLFLFNFSFTSELLVSENNSTSLKEISINDFYGDNFLIGNAEDKSAGTGCTVFIFKNGAPVGQSVRGGGPASRESELLKPLANAGIIHAILLSGGSAFGLDAAGGVMKYLEERDLGFDVGVTKVPLVSQSCLFDLTVAETFIRPNQEMAYNACIGAESLNFKEGNFGAGIGATVGKLLGMDYCMKSGIGYYGLQLGNLTVGAVVALNSLGDIFDWKTGKKIAGLLDENKKDFRSSDDVLYASYAAIDNRYVENTALAVVFTNAEFDKTKLCKIAEMAHNGFARSIRPVHTSADGDTIYAVSLGKLQADIDVVGSLASRVISEAIISAVYKAESAYGFPAAKDLNN
jgi:L-aminopeptidase/D-esterase-like protein